MERGPAIRSTRPAPSLAETTIRLGTPEDGASILLAVPVSEAEAEAAPSLVAPAEHMAEPDIEATPEKIVELRSETEGFAEMPRRARPTDCEEKGSEPLRGD